MANLLFAFLTLPDLLVVAAIKSCSSGSGASAPSSSSPSSLAAVSAVLHSIAGTGALFMLYVNCLTLDSLAHDSHSYSYSFLVRNQHSIFIGINLITRPTPHIANLHWQIYLPFSSTNRFSRGSSQSHDPNIQFP